MWAQLLGVLSIGLMDLSSRPAAAATDSVGREYHRTWTLRFLVYIVLDKVLKKHEWLDLSGVVHFFVSSLS